MKIWKYSIRSDQESVMLPRGAQALYVVDQYDDDDPVLYALVDPSQPLVERRLYVTWTGVDFDPSPNVQSLGVVRLADGDLMIHFLIEPEPGITVRDAIEVALEVSRRQLIGTNA